MAALGPLLRAGAGMMARGGGTAARTAGGALSSQGMKQAAIQGVAQSVAMGGLGGGSGQMGGLLNIGASIKAGAARTIASPATAAVDVMGAGADPRTASVIKGGLDVFKDTVGTAAKALDPIAMLNPKTWLEIGQSVMGLPNKMAKLGDAATAAAKELAGFSGAMAEAAIEQVFGDLRRSMEKAQQTGESTLSLTRSTESLKDGLAPIQNAITNVTNYLLQMGVEIIIAMLPFLEALFNFLKDVLVMMLRALAVVTDWIDGWGEGQVTKAIRSAATSIEQVEVNTRKEEAANPLDVLLQDLALGGLIR